MTINEAEHIPNKEQTASESASYHPLKILLTTSNSTMEGTTQTEESPSKRIKTEQQTERYADYHGQKTPTYPCNLLAKPEHLIECTLSRPT
jgi:hypothetical protein